jgi:serine/threonine protein kinase
MLGRGSFSEVFAATVIAGSSGDTLSSLGAALKDIKCSSEMELEQALHEVGLLDLLRQVALKTPLRIPRFLGHRVDRANHALWRVRIAMDRCGGEQLDKFFKRALLPGVDGPTALRRGCMLAWQVLLQLGPTLDQINKHCQHRDVNSHNILVSDALTGDQLAVLPDPNEMARRASFHLIDFGLAVRKDYWSSQWPTADVAGDCRYWGASSFLMSFYGHEHMRPHPNLCRQYTSRLDITGLGLVALEIMCSTVLPTRAYWGSDGLLGCWRNLFIAWEKYRDEVTRWHTQIFNVFHSGVDAGPLYRQLAKERVVERVTNHLESLRALLLACTRACAEDPWLQQLLSVLAETIDEGSTLSLSAMVHALNRPTTSASAGDAAVASSQTVKQAPLSAVIAAQVPTPARAGRNLPASSTPATPGMPRASMSFVPRPAPVFSYEPVASMTRLPTRMGGFR